MGYRSLWALECAEKDRAKIEAAITAQCEYDFSPFWTPDRKWPELKWYKFEEDCLAVSRCLGVFFGIHRHAEDDDENTLMVFDSGKVVGWYHTLRDQISEHKRLHSTEGGE